MRVHQFSCATFHESTAAATLRARFAETEIVHEEYEGRRIKDIHTGCEPPVGKVGD